MCWLDLTCPACGALLDRPDAHRPGCEAAEAAEREPYAGSGERTPLRTSRGSTSEAKYGKSSA